MKVKPESSEPIQKTPKGHEIPIPKRKDVFQTLKNAIKKPESRRERPDGCGDGISSFLQACERIHCVLKS